MKKQHFQILIAFLLVVMAGVFSLTLKTTEPGVSPRKESSLTPTTAGIEGLGGSWTLTDHNGHSVSDRDFSGSFRLMFFGFTYCPDVCPTELKRLTLVLQGLGAEATKVKPILVTIDPERDTPEVLKDYLARFDERFIGLTGSVEQIKHMEKLFKVYAARNDDPALSDYMMNHSALVYLIGPDDRVLHLFHSRDTPDDMIALIRKFLSQP